MQQVAVVPPAPSGLLRATVKRWEEFWDSPSAQAVTSEPATEALRRLFKLYDAWERAWQAFQKHPVVTGSTGQEVVNPLWREARRLESEIRALEDRFWITPWAAARGGITVGILKRSLEDLNRSANDDRDTHGTEADAAAG